MIRTQFKAQPRLAGQIRWTIFLRACFAVILIVASLVFSSQQNYSFFSQPFLTLYNIAGVILILSIFYLAWLNKFTTHRFLAFFQTILDTLIVTVIIYVTGSYESVFTFLYLVVIIYTSMILLLKGSLVIATLSSVLYAALIEFEYYGIVTPMFGNSFISDTMDESHIIYRIIIMILACFAVAILSGVLAYQLKGARQTVKMMEEHLRRTEKMQAIDEMISGIAHEVKNPLASLSGSIQLLHEDTTPGSYEDKLMQIILRETDRLKSIVDNIRLFSKPQKDNAKQIEPSGIIEETVELMSNDPEYSQRIDFSLELDQSCMIYIDSDHFKQILWNLMKNAAQAIEGSGKISIKLKPAGDTKVFLIIKDNGKGIAPDKCRHVFDPFYTTKPDGTGLGLPIIHRLIDTYDGMIDFESTPGKGSIFTVLFRVRDAAAR